eukprot:c21313_g1_i2 orf=756-3668(+)
MEEDDGTPSNQSAPEQEQIQEEESQEEQQDLPSSTLLPPPSPLPLPPSSTPPASDSTSDARQELEQNEYQHQHQHVAPPASRVPMGPKPAPTYNAIASLSDTETDDPGPRCAHTLTAVLAVGDENTPGYIGPRLILFGGATSIEDGSQAAGPQSIGGGAGIRLAGVTNDVHCYDILSNKWTRLHPAGEPPSIRAAHATTAVGTMVVTQGGIGPAGHSTEDLHVLDLTHTKPKWHRVVVQGPGPGPRYGHVMALVQQRFLVAVGGNDGNKYLSDAWSLDTATKPYEWRKLEPEGDTLPSCMYATASARADGLLLLCGGRDGSGMPLDSAFALIKHRDGRWEWARAPGVAPSPRYQHAAVFVDSRLHVTGGTLRGGRMVEGPSSAAVLDTNAAIWLDRNGVVTSPRLSRPSQDTGAVESTRRCRHAAAAVGNKVYLYGGLRGELLLDDLLVAEDPPVIENSHGQSVSNANKEGISNGVMPMDNSFNKAQRLASGEDELLKASIAEAEAMRETYENVTARAEANKTQGDTDQSMDEEERDSITDTNGNDAPGLPSSDVRLHHRAVVVAQEPGGALGGLVRQLSLDQFENEGRRVSYGNVDSGIAARQLLDRQMSTRGLHKKIISLLLLPRGWKPPTRRQFFLDGNDVAELCDLVQQIFQREPTVLKLKAPLKIFGDLHGQFGDLMRLFDEYGYPSTAGDITYIDYLFLGDYVDRGQHSLETICLLLALKIEYPEHIHLIRGNHEAADINALFGFRIECIERMGEKDGIWAWHRFNQLFNWLPLAALIEQRIICMHGGIGRSINYVSQIESLQRPTSMDAGSVVLMDLLWSDPTENDSVEGLRPNARGPGLVTFGPDRVIAFCKNNNLQLIVRAHECVMDGFERFAQGHLITLFSATNYCGTANNAGALLVLGRDLVVVPKLIHPLPPVVGSQELPGDGVTDEIWMQELNSQRPPTPTRGRPHTANDRSSLAWI